jgi:hypothetical protein
MNPSFGATCDQCGAPLEANAAGETTPLTETAVARKRMQPPSTIRLVGIWMLSLPNVVGGAYFALWLFKHSDGLAEFIILWGDVGLTCLWFFLFYRITRNYFFRGPEAESISTRQ